MHASGPDLDSRLARGVAWTVAAKWSVQVLSWGSMLVLARLLSPSDFGLVGMASVYLGLVSMVSEFGLSSAVLNLQTLSQWQIRQLNTFSLLLGVAAFLVSLAASVPLSRFFQTPHLAPVLALMSLSFIFAGLRTVPGGLLQRQMRFKELSLLEAAQALSQVLCSLSLAALGFGYWAIAVGNVVSSAVWAALTMLLAPQSFSKPDYASTRPALVFGSHMLVSRIAWYLHSNADFVIAGRLFGQGPLGAYTVAWNLASMPVEKITNIVTRVTPSAFAAVQKENAQLQRYFLGISEVLAFVTFPASFGLALVAPDLVPLALGPQWGAAVLPLQLLACAASIRSISTLYAQVLAAVGATRFVMTNSLFALIVMPSAFWIGSRWGLPGIACAWIIGHPISTTPILLYTLRRIHLPLRQYAAAIAPPFLGSVAMAAAVILLHEAGSSSLPAAVRLALDVAAGSAVYFLFFLLLFRDRARRYARLLQSFKAG